MDSFASSDPIAVTGLGAVSAYGVGWNAFRLGVEENRTAVAELTLFEPPGACERAAEAGELDPARFLFSTQTYLDRTTVLAAGAARLALDAANVSLPVALEGDPLGLAFGTTWGCMGSIERFDRPIGEGNPRRAQGLVFSHSFPNSPASLLAIEFGLRGYHTVHAGSRLAGVWALESAFSALRDGTSAWMLAGAAESLSAPVFAHYESRGELTGAALPRPYAPDADGTLLGEGAVFLVLENARHARARKAPALGFVSACSFGADPAALAEDP
ncbi:MAG: beta-ketoacyl synthase N-terminal-like domain-containing protein, partial [Planctomycetota bacterium]